MYTFMENVDGSVDMGKNLLTASDDKMKLFSE